jgi:hypothetical protein
MKNAGSRTGFVANVQQWAEQQFSRCELGDVRRTQRLVDYAARQAAQPDASTNAVCAGDDAVAEGTYRWMRNSAIDPKGVDEGPFAATVDACRGRELVLAIQDTTTLTFPHALAAELGSVGGVEGHHVGGVLVHSTLMVDAQSREPLGLIDQERWSRPVARVRSKPQRRKTKQDHKKRAYQDKESAKWEQATQRMSSRFGDTNNVLTVCDREADIYDYITYLVEHGQRFVLRAGQDRFLLTPKGHLFELMAQQPVIGTRSVEISQRGAQRGTPKQNKREARSARTATMSIRKATVKLARPANRRDGPEAVEIGVVYLRERNAPNGEKPAEWLLLTGEPVAKRAQVERVIGYYECRWLIEEFHKSWKTGCRLEQRRFQSLGNLERFLAVTAPIAVRILQLRTLAQLSPDEPCSSVLSRAHWECLAARVKPGHALPKRPPTLGWATVEIARLGGWRDTKQTGRIGWQALWRGWSTLEALVEGWSLAQR